MYKYSKFAKIFRNFGGRSWKMSSSEPNKGLSVQLLFCCRCKARRLRMHSSIIFVLLQNFRYYCSLFKLLFAFAPKYFITLPQSALSFRLDAFLDRTQSKLTSSPHKPSFMVNNKLNVFMHYLLAVLFVIAH